MLESQPHAGGVLRTVQHEGWLLELAANSFISSDPVWQRWLRKLGLEGEVVESNPEAKRRYLAHRGALVAMPGSPLGLLTTPLLSPLGKLRLVAEPLLARRGGEAEESLEAFGRRHVGAEATAVLLDAMQTGIHAGVVHELSAEAAFPAWVNAERERRSLLLGLQAARDPNAGPRRIGSLRLGMQQLVERLVERLEGAVRLSTPVESISREGKGWALKTASGIEAADGLVMAMAPGAAMTVLKGLDEGLSLALGAVPSAPLAVVHLGLPRACVRHPLDGFGFLASARAGHATLGCIFSSALFPGRAPEGKALLTVLAGGRRRPEVASMSDRQLGLLVRDELRMLLGLDGEPELLRVTRQVPGIPQLVVGHRARMETVRARLDRLPGLHLAGWGLRGVGLADCLLDAERVAQSVGVGGAP